MCSTCAAHARGLSRLTQLNSVFVDGLWCWHFMKCSGHALTMQLHFGVKSAWVNLRSSCAAAACAVLVITSEAGHQCCPINPGMCMRHAEMNPSARLGGVITLQDFSEHVCTLVGVQHRVARVCVLQYWSPSWPDCFCQGSGLPNISKLHA